VFRIVVFIIFIISIFSAASTASAKSFVLNSTLKVEHLLELSFKPSNFAFVSEKDILVLSRDDGKVYHIINNKLNPKPVVDVDVATVGYRGMLGIDTLTNKSGETCVFLYYTESAGIDGDDDIEAKNLEPLGNRLL